MADDDLAQRIDYLERAVRRLEVAIEHLRDLLRAHLASLKPDGKQSAPANLPSAPPRYRRRQFPDGPKGEMVDGWEIWAGEGTGWARYHGPPPRDEG